MSRYRNFHITFTITAKEGEAVRSAAIQEGVSVSNYIRRCISSTFLEGGNSLVIDEADRNTYKKYTPEYKQQALLMRARGLSVRKIATTLSCSSSRVQDWIRGCKAGEQV